MKLIRLSQLFFVFVCWTLFFLPLETFSQQDIKKQITKYANLPAEIQNLIAKQMILLKELDSLKKDVKNLNLLPDIEIYVKAIDWLIRTKDFEQKDIFKKANFIADQGLSRALKLKLNQKPWLDSLNTSQARAFRSAIDNSVQPYAIIYPKDYGTNKNKKYPLHLVLHGRNDKLNEVNFLYENRGDKPLANEQDFIQLSIYGRGNNAYRWSGESDLNEALENFISREKDLGRDTQIDRKRFVLRGFSMGGAGTWHLGLHQPDRWCVMGPGAGFTTTHGYAPNLPEKLLEPMESCLSIYDAYLYAENAFNIPVVAYSGEIDKQKQAADLMQKQIQSFGLEMQHIIAPGLEHKFPLEWQKKAFEVYAPHIAKGRPTYPEKIKFVTHTLKYGKCDWIEILGLEKHYARSRIEATSSTQNYTVKTENISKFAITLPDDFNKEIALAKSVTINIDSQKISAPYGLNSEFKIVLKKNDLKEWMVSKTEPNLGKAKTPGLQGPIDDAFSSSFLCVLGTNSPWNETANKASIEEVERFRKDWELFFRAELPIKKDNLVTTEDLETKNIILFGDGGSNSLIAKILPSSPIQWTKSTISLNNKTFSSADHLPVFIMPSPFSFKHYVVLNSGHTFRTEDLKATNAMLFPRLGDYSILKINPLIQSKLEIMESGLFNEQWALPKTKK